MATAHYKKTITEYLDTLPEETPVTPAMVTAYIAERTDEPEEKVRKAVNVNLARLEKDGVISRIAHGVYCKRIQTPFGDYVPGKDRVFGRWLVLDGDTVVGYETGLSLMNQLGLTTQIPNKRFIATNNYKLPLPKDVNIEVQKPRVAVTGDNYKYLQILDVITDLDQAPVDAAEPELIIREKAQDAGLQPDRLILYARKLYPTETLKKTIDIMLGGITL